MSLNWDISKTEGYKIMEAHKEAGREQEADAEWNVAETLIWATMMVDLGEITEKNKAEFLCRCRIAEGKDRPMRMKRVDGKTEYVYITAEEVERYIGLGTNVADLPKTKWFAKFYKDQMYRAEVSFRRIKEEKEKTNG